jgi:hypothetical protein
MNGLCVLGCVALIPQQGQKLSSRDMGRETKGSITIVDDRCMY